MTLVKANALAATTCCSNRSKARAPSKRCPTADSTLSDEQVWQLLAFIRTLYKGDTGKIGS